MFPGRVYLDKGIRAKEGQVPGPPPQDPAELRLHWDIDDSDLPNSISNIQILNTVSVEVANMVNPPASNSTISIEVGNIADTESVTTVALDVTDITTRTTL